MITTTIANSTATSSGWWQYGEYFHSWFFFGSLFWLVPLVILVAVVIILASRGSSSPKPAMSNPHDSAIQILEERYAKGEITKEQFEQMRKRI